MGTKDNVFRRLIFIAFAGRHCGGHLSLSAYKFHYPALALPDFYTGAGIPPQRYIEVTGCASDEMGEPRSYTEAIQSPEKSAWQSAMEEEINSLHENESWELVKPPPGRKIVGCKWTYKKKLDENGQVVRYKARLVAQGFSQQYGTDYDEVFAPVAKQTTLRTVLSVANRTNMIVKHLDIRCAYLYADLK